MRKHGELDEVNAEVGLIVLNIFKHFGESLEPQIGLSLRDNLIKIGFMLTSLDFQLFKQYAMEGKYKNRVDLIEGKEFAIKFFKLTPDVLIDWLKVYIFERGEVFANSQIKPKNEVITESQADVIKIFLHNIPKENKMELEEVGLTDQQRVKEMVTKIHNEFKALQTDANSSFVEVNGKHYDYNEFLKLRTNENISK